MIDALIAQLDAISRQGVVAVVKRDGERAVNRYTVVISGTPLGDDYFRKDGSDLAALLDRDPTRELRR